MQSQHLERFRGDGRFLRVRQTGTITAMELTANTQGYLSEIGPSLRAAFHAANILLRPLGNTIYVLPPYCVTHDDLTLIYDAIASAVSDI
jgi:adenosylmethionine-8-amino-7-oxononanoate aminotransferase